MAAGEGASSSPAAASGWQPPDQIEEYRVVRLIGAGAIGRVYLAEDLLLGRAVALKLLDREPDAAARAQFFVEARAVARLSHPNVVAIHRVGEIARRPYIVSELVRGPALDKLPAPLAATALRQVALGLVRGLAAAHRRGVLHRDLKPANVMLTEEGEVKLLDFGMAKLVDEAPRAAREALVGSPMYLAPELWRGEPASRRSDLYALGALLYELCTGRLPYAAATLAELRAALAAGPPPSLAELVRVAAQGTRGGRESDDDVDGDRVRRNVDGYDGGDGHDGDGGAAVGGNGLTIGRDVADDGERGRGDDVSGRDGDGGAAVGGNGLTIGRDIARGRRAGERARILAAIDARLAAAVDRCLSHDPAARFASADALRDALEEPAAATAAAPAGNPYRGLRPFDAEHRAVFFGRDAVARLVLDRLRVEPLVLLVGDSGVGKSSLAAAAVLPLAAERCGWHTLALTPGRHPLTALCSALAPHAGVAAATLGERLRSEPHALADALRQRGAALLLLVDQLEELLTVADADEARLAAAALGALGGRAPMVRLLGTARSDFLTRLGTLPGLGAELGRAVELVPPLGADGMREAIVGPARATGVRFESEALAERLIASAAGGLPFLQFALAELWEARDREAGVIRAATLDAIGGVDGALARHADRVLERLLPAERAAARRLLVALVTPDGTRARLGARELVAAGDRTAARALEALVRGRLLVAHGDDGGEADAGLYEIAHEALLVGWDTLRGWLAGDVGERAARQRLERAAAEWERLSRPRDALYRERQLAEARALAGLGPREAAFLAASRAAARRRTLGRAALVAAAPLAVLAVLGGARWQARRHLDLAVDERAQAAARRVASARAFAAESGAQAALAFARFDAADWPAGEREWARALALGAAADHAYVEAAALYESALALERGRAAVREPLADVLYERVLLAERAHRDELAAELRARLPSYDPSGARVRRLDEPAEVTLRPAPPDAAVTLERYQLRDGHLVPSAPAPVHGRLRLAPGSYRLRASASGRAAVDLPLAVERGERLELPMVLPPAAAVPAGFVYVPAGRFLFGSRDAEEVRRGFLRTVPLHPVTTPAYLIARHEVTFAEWITYLEALPPAERRRRTPAGQSSHNALELRELGGGDWLLRLRPTSFTYEARRGEPIRYRERERRVVQDWTRFPVAGVSFDDALAYAAWLDASGRLPGARLCDEHEWERAARGADDRTFPSGPVLDADDSDHDVTYGRRPLGFGPDEVGSHPGSRSPFGVDDLAGNVWEWVRSVARPDEIVYRGGSWYQGELSSRAANREVGERTMRHPFHGLRLCATPPPGAR